MGNSLSHIKDGFSINRRAAAGFLREVSFAAVLIPLILSGPRRGLARFELPSERKPGLNIYTSAPRLFNVKGGANAGGVNE